MKMTFRWYGTNNDNIKLTEIKQIPGMNGVVGALFDVPVGDVWSKSDIQLLKEEVEAVDLSLKVIESVNIHDDIKIGLPSRDKYIANYIETIKNLAEFGIEVICYNFMPIFDWMRTDLAKTLPDGSNVLSFENDKIQKDPADMVKAIEENSKGFILPGWEPERLSSLQKLFTAYKDVDENKLKDNLKYFLERVIPVCEEVGIKMAIHPDDPPRSIFGLPRIVKNKIDLENIVAMVDSTSNGITLCSGSLGANPENDVPELIRHFGSQGRIPFVHLRNIKILANGDFHETSHLSSDGTLDMFEIVKSLHDIDFQGYARPDHGRMIWNEKGRPGYGLYDRALGVTYLNGLYEAIEKMK